MVRSFNDIGYRTSKLNFVLFSFKINYVCSYMPLIIKKELANSGSSNYLSIINCI